MAVFRWLLFIIGAVLIGFAIVKAKGVYDRLRRGETGHQLVAPIVGTAGLFALGFILIIGTTIWRAIGG